MSFYTTGSVNINVGGTSIVGNNTNFSSYAAAGDIFKLANRTNVYEIAAINTATNLTLTSRFRDTLYETARTAEHLATTQAATLLTYTATIANLPLLQETLVVTGSEETWTDSDGSGSLSCTSSPTGSSGTVDYDTGALSLTYSASPTTDYSITAAYTSGDSINSMEYQVVSDFTTYYSLPELSMNDTNFQAIYTKAMRLIDSALHSVDGQRSTATKTADYSITSSDYGHSLRMNSTSDKTFTLPSVSSTDDGARVTLLKLNTGRVTIAASDSDTIDDSSAAGTIYNNQSDETYASIMLEYVHSVTKWFIISARGTWETT